MKIINLIDEELARVIYSLKSEDMTGLLSYEGNPVKREYVIFGNIYPLVIFSKSDQDGALNVIAEITKTHFFKH